MLLLLACTSSPDETGVLLVDPLGFPVGEDGAFTWLGEGDPPEALGDPLSVGPWGDHVVARYRVPEPEGDVWSMDWAGHPVTLTWSAAPYAEVAASTTVFLQAQRDGADVVADVMERQPAHLHDAAARVYAPDTMQPVGGPVDVEGGWFDAGDYLKFVETTSYVVGVALMAGRSDPALATEAAHGVAWLKKAWDGETLLYQVGVGDGTDAYAGDHDVWRLPETDDARTDPWERFLADRPVFATAPPLSPNLGGRLTAAFSLCAQVLGDEDCATRAASAWAATPSDWSGELLTVQPWDYYPETSFHDDLAWGAAELCLATGDACDTAEALVGVDDDGDTLNLYDVRALADAELYDATGSAAALEALRTQLDGVAADPFGAAPTGDAVPHVLGVAATARLYRERAGDDTYVALEQAQRDWLLGANPWGVSFVYGAGADWPRCPQHQIANLTGLTLLGGVGAGPAAPDDLADLDTPDDAAPCAATHAPDVDGGGWTFLDDVSAWPTVEPALDYAALVPLAFGG